MPSTVRYRFGPQVCGSLAEGTAREWLVPDGCGGYAMGTVGGLRTRRYHGLLVVAGSPGPGGGPLRSMALASLDPTVTFPSGARVRLGTHEWASGVVQPAGHARLECFELRDGLPRWRWRVGEVVLERELALAHGSPSLAVVHRLIAGPAITLTLDALCTWRDAHGERRAEDDLTVESTVDGVVVENAYRLAGPGFEPDGHWWLGVHAREEAARGLAAEEDLRCVGRFSARLAPGECMAVSAWAGDAATLATAPPPAERVIEAAAARARGIATAASDATAAALSLAADAFVVNGPASAGPDVIAGYPWFGAWSRDTMTSYEGLFLTTGRTAEGRDLLKGYAATLSQGMLANTADSGSAQFNTADATLWLLHAVDRHVVMTGDDDLAAELVDALDAVVAAHLAGTRYGIRVDPADNLLRQGAEGKALTWMDAVVNGRPVTPRQGKAVEINALWVNGLAAVAGLRERLGRDASTLRATREKAVESFRRRFSAVGWLYDVVDPTEAGGPSDPSLRPNQLLAFGLPYAPMRGTDPAHATAIVRAIGGALLTPLGPRSLAATDPAYQGRHRGDVPARDRAYHQGTIWPWLIGPYVDACLATGVPVDGVLDGLVAHLGDWGIGSVSETAEGDPPHPATGCPFQAWSVAELNRAYGIAR